MTEYKSELRTELEESHLEIDFKATHMGLLDKTKDWTSPHDEWRVSISYKGKSYETIYRTGIGHRKLVSRRFKKEPKGIYDDRMGWMNDYEAAKHGFLVKQSPDLADVLACLLSDASGVDQPFENWASDLGYDSDSRKALEIYLECQKTRADLVTMFGSELFEKLYGLSH